MKDGQPLALPLKTRGKKTPIPHFPSMNQFISPSWHMYFLLLPDYGSIGEHIEFIYAVLKPWLYRYLDCVVDLHDSKDICRLLEVTSFTTLSKHKRLPAKQYFRRYISFNSYVTTVLFK